MPLSMLSAQFSVLTSASALASALALGSPAYLQADAAQSSVSATIRRADASVTGQFSRFDARIAFDPENPKRARATVNIDTRSFDLGDRDANRTVKGRNWFDTADYPSASFTSTSIVPAGEDRYSMTGRLTIRGRTQDVVVPVSVGQNGAMRVIDGSLPVNRLRFGIGRGAPASEAAGVAEEVVIRFHLVVPVKDAQAGTSK
jgi:polyisoprenoid-binding protein YceI